MLLLAGAVPGPKPCTLRLASRRRVGGIVHDGFVPGMIVQRIQVFRHGLAGLPQGRQVAAQHRHAIAAYLHGIAADQYISEFRFSVRRQMPLKMETTAAGMSEAPAGIAAAMAVITDSQMVVQYLKSAQIIEDMIAAGVDLDAIYAGSDHDLWAHLRRNATLEDRQRYWKSMVDPFFDMSNGIVRSRCVRSVPPIPSLSPARRWRCARS
jgi:hypothetical protein